jgi:multidrug efflux pump subunit AcrA (membrane-fusion protein)
VKVSITDADGRLFPDMSSTVYFLPPDSKAEPDDDLAHIFCPADCVVQHQGKEVVWTVDKDGHAQPVSIVVGRKKDGQVEIVEGLQGSERLIAKPPELSANQAVKVVD